MHIFSFSRPSVLLLHHGLFAILCHVSAIFLFATTLQSRSALIFTHSVFPLLEHSLISLVALFVGVLGLEYIHKYMRSDSD
jgi:hypothetical protein